MDNPLTRDYSGQYRRNFLDQLTQQLKSLGAPDSEIQPFKDVLCSNGTPALSDLFGAESLLVTRMPDERLDVYAVSLTSRYELIVGTPMAKVPPEGSPNLKRQVLIESLNEMCRIAQSRMVKEDSLASHVRWLSGFGFVATVGLLGFAYFGPVITRDDNKYIPPLAFILVAGGIGGVIGHLRDILKPRGKTDLMLLTFELEATRKYWIYRIFAGLLYAMVFTLIAGGGLVKSELLPDLTGHLVQLRDAKTVFPTGLAPIFAYRALPTEEYCKLIFWCFVAGCYQPFVPGILDRLAARADSLSQAPANRTG